MAYFKHGHRPLGEGRGSYQADDGHWYWPGGSGTTGKGPKLCPRSRRDFAQQLILGLLLLFIDLYPLI